MVRYVFRLPDVGEGVAEADIVAWHVKPDEILAEGQAMVDVMTDKATVEMTAPVGGRITALHGEIGERVAVGAPLVEFECDPDAALAAVPQIAEPPAPRAEAGLLAAPATRRRARELGIALHLVPGTGPEGRITPQDVDDFNARAGAAMGRAAERHGVTETPITGLRRKIAEKMQESKRHIPHFSYVEEFDLTELEALRQDLNANHSAGRPALTLLPFLMRALVRLVPEFPQINARFDAEAGILRVYDGIHIGIATHTPGGLMVPVVRHAEARDLWDCARELSRVTTAAREGRATRDALMGATITLSSLGALGGIAATPIINPPEVAILGPNRLVERPVVRNGQIVSRMMMNLSSSFDHRIVDGHDAAQFIQGLKRLMERPALLFLA